MNEDKDLIFLDDFKKRQEKDNEKESKQTLELKHLRDLIDRGLYEPDFDKIAEAFIEEEFQAVAPESSDQSLSDDEKS